MLTVLQVCLHATSDVNHVKASSSPGSVEQNDVLSDILVQPNPKETSRRKRKAGIKQKSVCLTDDDVLSGLKEEVQRKKDEELDKTERKRIREEKKAKKERLKKEKEEKKKKKEQAKKAGEGPEDVEVEELLGELAVDGNESDAECPKYGLLYSADEENLWVCCDRCSLWYDFKCTKLRSRRNLPATYVCDLCK